LDHSIHVTARATAFDWVCSCGERATRLLVTRSAAESDALRHTPASNRVTRHDHTR